MKRFTNRMITVCLAAAMAVGSFGTSALADEIDNESAVAGISVSLNNYYAASYTPQEDILEYLMPQMNVGETEAATAAGTAAAGTAASETAAAGLIAEGAAVQNTGMISVLGQLNIRKGPSKAAESLGYLYSNCKVDIYDAVSNEEGDWYLVSANGLEGYVSSVYVRTGQAAEIAASNISNKVAVITADSLEAKDAATADAKAVDTLYKDERYSVVETQGDYVKLSNADYVIGYVSMAGVKIETQLPEALAAEDTATVELLQESYMQDIDYTQSEYTRRMVAGDYRGALNAATYVVELWGYYISDAAYAGLDSLAEAAGKEREAAIVQMNEVQAIVDQLPAETAPETAPETVPAVTEAPGESELPVVVPTMAPVIVKIEACYLGGTKYVGDVISASELYIRATYSDGSVGEIYDGWWSDDVGMVLTESPKVVTMHYNEFSSSFELPVYPAPTQAPAPAPTQAPTAAPTEAPTAAPTQAPVVDPARDYRSEIVAYATSWVGRCSYVWGGETLAPGGQVDCSGFTMCVFRDVAGISLPHYSYSQLNCGSAISYEQLRPGDLVFYNRHVAIYIGGGQIVHAKSATAGIVIDSVFFSASQPPIGYRSLLP